MSAHSDSDDEDMFADADDDTTMPVLSVRPTAAKPAPAGILAGVAEWPSLPAPAPKQEPLEWAIKASRLANAAADAAAHGDHANAANGEGSGLDAGLTID